MSGISYTNFLRTFISCTGPSALRPGMVTTSSFSSGATQTGAGLPLWSPSAGTGSDSYCMAAHPPPAGIWWPHGQVPNSASVAHALMPPPGMPTARQSSATADAAAGRANVAAVPFAPVAAPVAAASEAAAPDSTPSGACSASRPVLETTSLTCILKRL